MREKEKRPIRAAIYCRCSTDEQWQGKDFSTLESQASICKHAVAMKEHEGWSLGQIFEDGGFSGGSIERPALAEMIAEIEAGNIQAVIVYRLDRLTRSIADFYSVWEIFEKHGVVFMSATEAFSTDTPSGELFLNILLSLAQWERQLIRQRVSDKVAERSKQGLWNGGRAPYGYDYDKEQKLLVPHRDDAPIVKDIFKRVAQQGSPVSVAKQLNDDGLRTTTRTVTGKNGKQRVVGGKRWIGQNVTRVVRNPLYKAIIVHNEEEYPARHEALVSTSLWKKANKALIDKQPPQKKDGRRTNHHEMLFKGLLRCGHCGKHLVPKPAGKKDASGNPYLYYTCGDVNKHGKQNGCVLRSLPARAFEDFILKLIGELGKHPEIVKATAEASKKDHLKAIKPFEAKLRKVAKELKEVSGEVASLVEMAKRPEMKNLASDFMEEADKLGARKSDLQMERQKLQMEIDYRRNLVTDEKIICEKLNDFTALFGEMTFEERAELMSLILKEIRVSRFDPDKDPHPCNSDAFVTKMRTSWFRVDLRLFSNTLKIKEMLQKPETAMEVRNKQTNGNP